MSSQMNPSKTFNVTALWDGGSTLSFVTFRVARALKLRGTPIKLEITTLGNKIQQIDSFAYTVMLESQQGKRIPIKVLGIEKISTNINEINFQVISKLFNTKLNIARRRSGKEIDVLIGMQYAGFHPVRQEANGHLLLLENQFGQVVAGSHLQWI